jgi:hypothetical protein
VDVGLAELIGHRPPAANDTSTDVVGAVGEIQAHVSYLINLTDRSLFASSLAWAFARQAALRGERSPDALNQSLIQIAEEAYQRQLDRARGGVQ